VGSAAPTRAKGNPQALGRIGRATNHLQGFGTAVVDLANPQAIRLGMRRDGHNACDHYPMERRRCRLDAVHFQAAHGQHMGQLLGSGHRLHPFFQPIVSKAHRSPIRAEI